MRSLLRNKEDRDMQKLESSLKNMVLVLVGVALIVGAVLAYINHLTSGPIAEKAAQSLAAGIKSVMGTEELQVAEPEEVKQEFGGKEFSFTIHKCSDKSGKQLGAAVESTTGGFGGDLKVLVGFDTEGKILSVKANVSTETQGVGSKVGEASMLEKFEGLSGDVSGVTLKTGATFTSNAVRDGVQAACAALAAIQ